MSCIICKTSTPATFSGDELDERHQSLNSRCPVAPEAECIESVRSRT